MFVNWKWFGNNGRLRAPWEVAWGTSWGHFSSPIDSVNLTYVCEDLMDILTSESKNPKHRIALRTSSHLLGGVCNIYKEQMNKLWSEICKDQDDLTSYDFDIIRWSSIESGQDHKIQHQPSNYLSSTLLEMNDVEQIRHLHSQLDASLDEVSNISFSDEDLPSENISQPKMMPPYSRLDTVKEMGAVQSKNVAKYIHSLSEKTFFTDNEQQNYENLALNIGTAQIDNEDANEYFNADVCENTDEYAREEQINELSTIPELSEVNRTSNLELENTQSDLCSNHEDNISNISFPSSSSNRPIASSRCINSTMTNTREENHNTIYLTFPNNKVEFNKKYIKISKNLNLNLSFKYTRSPYFHNRKHSFDSKIKEYGPSNDCSLKTKEIGLLKKLNELWSKKSDVTVYNFLKVYNVNENQKNVLILLAKLSTQNYVKLIRKQKDNRLMGDTRIISGPSYYKLKYKCYL